VQHSHLSKKKEYAVQIKTKSFEKTILGIQFMWTQLIKKRNKSDKTKKNSSLGHGYPSSIKLVTQSIVVCGGLTLAGCKVPNKAAPSVSSSSGRQGRENTTKGLRVDIRTGRDHSPVNVTGKTDSTWGESNLMYYQSKQSRIIKK